MPYFPKSPEEPKKRNPFLDGFPFLTLTILNDVFRLIDELETILETFTREQQNSVTHRGVRALHLARKDLQDCMRLR